MTSTRDPIERVSPCSMEKLDSISCRSYGIIIHSYELKSERNEMPNIAAVLKEEISRLARKEIRKETGTLQTASTQYRRDVAALKREVGKLQKQVALLERKVLTQPVAEPGGEKRSRIRFTAKGLRAQRKRLGLSAGEYAKLVGVTPQSIYNWEREAARPRKEQVSVLAALRGIGKKEAVARLRQLADQKSQKKKS